MRLVNDVLRVLVVLVLSGGLVWAVAVWRSRRRTAALVAAACSLQLATRLIWTPGVRLLFGPLSVSSNSVQRFFLLSAVVLNQLSLALALGLLVFAALDPANRRT